MISAPKPLQDRAKPSAPPAEISKFIGRRFELATARRSLEQSRLVTLTGVGGVGKTRLALRLAADVARAYEDGVWVVELAEVQDPDLLGHTVNGVLGLRESSARWQLSTLVQHIGNQHILLLLDNCEHLIDAVASLIVV